MSTDDHIHDPAAIRWQIVPSHPDYEVSDQGGVRRRTPGRGKAIVWRELTPYPTPTGYLQVTLCDESGRNYRSVHGLVVEAFIGPRLPGMEVCHENGCRTDNRLANLRYDTHAGNMADCNRHGTSNRGSANRGAKLTPGDVATVRRLIAEGRGNREIAPAFGVTHSAISAIRTGKKWGWLS